MFREQGNLVIGLPEPCGQRQLIGVEELDADKGCHFEYGPDLALEIAFLDALK
jgi:hypothetical protein